MSTSATLGHKRGRTSYDANIGELVNIDYALGRAIDTLSNSGFSESIDEVAAVKKVLIDARDEIKHVQELRQANATYDIKAIPFSKMEAIHYDRLNVSPRSAIAAARFNIAVGKLKTRNFPTAPIWKYTALQEGLEQIKSHVNTTHEAGCRMKIDQQLFAVIDYCKSAAVPIIYVVPELQISSQTKTKEAVSIRTAKELTFITGSTDYGILAIPGIQASQPVSQIMRIKNVQDSADLFIDYPERHLLVIEAKRNGNLEEFIPQVVAQCLAIWKLLQILEVPFCLTDGSNWIFGLLHCAAINDNTAKCVLWRSEVLRVDVHDYSTVMHPLFLWTVCSGMEIRDMFEKS